MLRRAALIVATLVALIGYSAGAHAAELLMFETRGCPWCKLWNAEVAPGYGKSSEGQYAPLRRLDLRNGMPDDVVLKEPVVSSPTFVLVVDGREFGRIVGYPGADFFWALLGELVRKAQAQSTPPATTQPRPI